MKADHQQRSRAKKTKKPKNEETPAKKAPWLEVTAPTAGVAGAVAGLMIGLGIGRLIGGAAGTWVALALAAAFGALVGGRLSYRLIKRGYPWQLVLLVFLLFETLTVSLLIAGLTHLEAGLRQAGETRLICRRLETFHVTCRSQTSSWLGLASQNEEIYPVPLVSAFGSYDQEGRLIKEGPPVLAGDPYRALEARFGKDTIKQIDSFIYAAESDLTIIQSHWVAALASCAIGCLFLLIDGLILWRTGW
jgi:hypothetical protein